MGCSRSQGRNLEMTESRAGGQCVLELDQEHPVQGNSLSYTGVTEGLQLYLYEHSSLDRNSIFPV